MTTWQQQNILAIETHFVSESLKKKWCDENHEVHSFYKVHILSLLNTLRKYHLIWFISVDEEIRDSSWFIVGKKQIPRIPRSIIVRKFSGVFIYINADQRACSWFIETCKHMKFFPVWIFSIQNSKSLLNMLSAACRTFWPICPVTNSTGR